MLAAQGLDIKRSVLAFWVGYAAAELEPIYLRLRKLILASGKIAFDETKFSIPAAAVPSRYESAWARLTGQWRCAGFDFCLSNAYRTSSAQPKQNRKNRSGSKALSFSFFDRDNRYLPSVFL